MTGFVSRADWGAKAPLDGILTLNPTFGTTVHYEGGTGLAIKSHDQCPSIVRGIQAFHMAPVSQGGRGWLDIAYTGLGCPHDYVFEGRWIGRRTAAQGTDVGNGQAYALCALLDTTTPLTDGLRNALVGGIQMLRHPGAGHNVNGHRDWLSTDCPRDDLYAEIPDLRARADGAPAPTPPQEDDDMVKQIVLGVPWPQDKPAVAGADPHFVAFRDDDPHIVAVASMNDARFDPPFQPGSHPGYDDVVFVGLWWRRFHTAGPLVGGGLSGDGNRLIITAEGGHNTFTVATRQGAHP